MEAYTVYKKYQMAIHNDKPDDCDMKSYKSFLVDSPLTVGVRILGSVCARR